MTLPLARIVHEIRDGHAGPEVADLLAAALVRGGMLSANDLDSRRRAWLTLRLCPLRADRVLVLEPDVGIVEWTVSRPMAHRHQGRHVADDLESALLDGDLVLPLPAGLDPRCLLAPPRPHRGKP